SVGDDALAPDRDVLEGGDRALLPEHGLGPDPYLALVRADLRPVADPRPAPEVDDRVLADLERHAGADEGEPVGLQAPAEAQLQPPEAHDQARVVPGEHAVLAHPAPQRERAAVARRGLAADVRRQPRDPRRCDDRSQGRKGSLRGSMAAEPSLAQRLLA